MSAVSIQSTDFVRYEVNTDSHDVVLTHQRPFILLSHLRRTKGMRLYLPCILRLQYSSPHIACHIHATHSH